MEVAKMLLNVFFFLLVFACIIFLAYAVTKLLGRKMANNMQGKLLSVVETINLGIDKQIHVIKVGEQFFLVSSAGKNIGYLSEVNLKDVVIDMEKVEAVPNDFVSILTKYTGNFITTLKEKNQNTSQRVLGNAAKQPLVKQDNEIQSRPDHTAFKSNLDKLKRIYDNSSTNTKDKDEQSNV